RPGPGRRRGAARTGVPGRRRGGPGAGDQRARDARSGEGERERPDETAELTDTGQGPSTFTWRFPLLPCPTRSPRPSTVPARPRTVVTPNCWSVTVRCGRPSSP